MNIRPIHHTTKSKKLAEEIAQFNAAAGQHAAAVQNISDGSLADGDGLGQLTQQHLEDERQVRSSANLMLHQETADLLQRRAELAKQVLDDATAAVSNAEKACDAAATKTGAQLKEIGLGPEATMAGQRGTNPAAAEHQFQHIVRMAIPVRTAEQARNDAQRRLESARADVATSAIEAHQAREELREFVSAQVA